MKALILAAGLGTRLRPVTESIPKALVPIGGKPLLKFHLDNLSKFGINDILVNTHYLYNQVEDFLSTYLFDHSNTKIVTSFESELLGSAGTLVKNQDFFENEKNFLVVYGDNLTNINYQNLIDFHLKRKSIATIACYVEQDPQNKGIISFDQNFKILEFLEKPKNLPNLPHWANAGIYVFSNQIFKYLDFKAKPPYDFGHHVFPDLLQMNLNLQAYLMNEFLLDIGSEQSYNKAQELLYGISF